VFLGEHFVVHIRFEIQTGQSNASQSGVEKHRFSFTKQELLIVLAMGMQLD
jgi:hypothetical protein